MKEGKQQNVYHIYKKLHCSNVEKTFILLYLHSILTLSTWDIIIPYFTKKKKIKLNRTKKNHTFDTFDAC